MTCAEMGGPCDAKITSASAEENMTKGMAHLEAAHPDMAASVKAMPKEEMEKKMAEINATYAAKPEDAA